MIVGIDEVGRGCWAGPVVAGAVLLGDGAAIPGLRDSKKLSKKRRIMLDAEIRLHALAYGVGWVSPEELDRLGLTEAVRVAMLRALAGIESPYDAVIIDGSYNFMPENPLASTLVKADDLIPAVSAASIIAKVARDTYMANATLRYPGYGFENHVGYGTAEHQAALRLHGACQLHRRSFAPIRALTNIVEGGR